MFKTKEQQSLTWVKLLLIGLPGVGKTRLASTCGIEPLMYDFDGGGDTVPIYRQVPPMTLTGYNEAIHEFKALGRLQPQDDGLLHHKVTLSNGDALEIAIDTLIIDTLTTAQEHAMVKIGNGSKDKRAWYGKLLDEMRSFMGSVFAINAHTVFVGHSKVYESETKGKIDEVSLFMDGSIKTRVAGKFDFILHLVRKGDGKVYLITRESIIGGKKYQAKDRHNIFGGKEFEVAMTHEGRPDPALMKRIFDVCAGGVKEISLHQLIAAVKVEWITAAKEMKILSSRRDDTGLKGLIALLGDTYTTIVDATTVEMIDTIKAEGIAKIAGYVIEEEVE